MPSWEHIHFAHVGIVDYLTPPDLVSLIMTCRDASRRFDGPEVYRMLAKTCYGDRHGWRRRRRKKSSTTSWRCGDGAKARLCALWAEAVQEQRTRIQTSYLVEREGHERRWILQKTADVMRSCVYGGRQGRSCCHSKLRLWAFAAAITANLPPMAERQVLRHPGIRCDRCGTGPVMGHCFRCVGSCKGVSAPLSPLSGEGGRRGVVAGRSGSEGRKEAGSGVGESGVLPEGNEVGKGEDQPDQSREGGGEGGGYNLCEACFRRRRDFHPPHPFVCLDAGFAERRLTFPMQYEAVCGDCCFGSLVNIRPLRAYEAPQPELVGSGKPGGGHVAGTGIRGGDLWAVPVRVEAVGPLPLSQVRTRMLAGQRHGSRGLVFASDNWGWGTSLS
ncbi:unnamed protein product [Discosporangium mesarthrocarpum]